MTHAGTVRLISARHCCSPEAGQPACGTSSKQVVCSPHTDASAGPAIDCNEGATAATPIAAGGHRTDRAAQQASQQKQANKSKPTKAAQQSSIAVFKPGRWFHWRQSVTCTARSNVVLCVPQQVRAGNCMLCSSHLSN